MGNGNLRIHNESSGSRQSRGCNLRGILPFHGYGFPFPVPTQPLSPRRRRAGGTGCTRTNRSYNRRCRGCSQPRAILCRGCAFRQRIHHRDPQTFPRFPLHRSPSRNPHIGNVLQHTRHWCCSSRQDTGWFPVCELPFLWYRGLRCHRLHRQPHRRCRCNTLTDARRHRAYNPPASGCRWGCARPMLKHRQWCPRHQRSVCTPCSSKSLYCCCRRSHKGRPDPAHGTCSRRCSRFPVPQIPRCRRWHCRRRRTPYTDNNHIRSRRFRCSSWRGTGYPPAGAVRLYSRSLRLPLTAAFLPAVPPPSPWLPASCFVKLSFL